MTRSCPAVARRAVSALFVAAVLAGAVRPAAGQQPIRLPPWGAAVGVSGGAGTGGGMGIVEAMVRRGVTLYGVRAINFPSVFQESVSDVGVLLGTYTPVGPFSVSSGVGIARTRVLRCASGTEVVGGGFGPVLEFEADDLPCIPRTGVGVPFSVRLLVRPMPFVELGLSGFANFNDQRSFGGIALGLYLGRLR